MMDYKNLFTEKELAFINEWIQYTKNSKFNEKLCEQVIWAFAILTKNKNISLNLQKDILDIVNILLNENSETTIRHTLHVFEKNNEYASFIYGQKLKTMIAARERIDKNGQI